MAIKKTSKEEILNESINLFKIKGYYNCSMANIADACGLIKGSIYHYFKSKDEIGIESLKYIHNYFVDNIFSIAYQTNLSDLEKIKLFVKKTDEYFLNSKGGCLLGNLALEVCVENLEFKEIIKEYFNMWENALIEIFKNKYSKSESEILAKEYVSLTQGAIMMMNLYNTPENYLKVGEKLISLI
ncbi:TetR/AcrR family transcriptional regulator [Arcobacter porcinus]|uniref:HTH-type transcriptional regulator YxaF n=1 Tax=Arcobacter porcinus TaxID=1935204 RepID=A0ABX2YC75_9BACT|nr:TetR/AcrR family transcriptional regulator [Arcobacter porcinus]OCL83161.1 putative HTH-type transcriptional regulator YxaF [Arcobacter porcinus]OCL83347.1 putative HTH-type transcriptional regulator YxaF [Arcobacter porcinus]OCL92595.1 putative HTH-type transcriptional regulator YxaF [Arcobacter porcinus]